MAHRKSVPATMAVAVVFLAQAIGAAAQPEESDWVTIADVPGLAALNASAEVASDASGSAVLVGFSQAKRPSALAWYSPDGASWSQVELPDAKASQAFAVASGPAGYVAVGRSGGEGRIWHSPTGESWSDVGAGVVPSGGLLDVAANLDGYTAVGFANTGKGKKARSIPTAWSSSDGLSWSSAPLSDATGAGLDVTASQDGSPIATVYEPERAGPKRGRTFDILPPSLSIATSADDGTWQRPAEPLVHNLTYLQAWDLAEAGGQFVFQADTAPGAVTGTPEGFLASEDGLTWEPISGLVGIKGRLAPLGEGAVAVGDGTVLVSEDLTTWRSSYEDALAGARVLAITPLADGRVLAVGPPPGNSALGAVLYLGTPPVEGPLPSTDCLDPAFGSQIIDSGPDIFTLPASEREQMASAMAALELGDEVTRGARDGLVRDLRRGASGDPIDLLRIQAGEITLPMCD